MSVYFSLSIFKENNIEIRNELKDKNKFVYGTEQGHICVVKNSLFVWAITPIK